MSSQPPPFDKNFARENIYGNQPPPSAPPQPPYNQNFPQSNPNANRPPPPGPTINIHFGVPPVATGQRVQPGYTVYRTQPQTVVREDCHRHHRRHHHHQTGREGHGGGGEACCLAGLLACLCFICLRK